MKPKVRKNIQTYCSQYLKAVKDGEIQPLFIEGGEQKHPYFNGFVQQDRAGYMNILAQMMNDEGFSQTIPASIAPEDLDNPYFVIPVDGYRMWTNPDVNSVASSLTTDPVGAIMAETQIFNPSLSFLTNIATILALLAQKYRAVPDPSDQRQIDRTATSATADQIAKRIRLLKGKISLARRGLAKGNPDSQKRIDLLTKEIASLRAGKTATPSVPPRRYEILKMGLEMRGRGFQNLFRWLSTLPLEEHVDTAFRDSLSKKMKGNIESFTKTIKMMDSDILSYLDLLTAGYEPLTEVSPADDTEILLHTTNYFMIRADLTKDFDSLFLAPAPDESTGEDTEEQ